MSDQDECRREFEAWLKANGLVEFPPDSWRPEGPHVNLVWQAWQAAWAKRGEPQWRPIEAAPKDGSHVLVAEFGVVNEARYIEGHGWYLAGAESTDYIDGRLYNPTHWMPLPQPPKESAYPYYICSDCGNKHGRPRFEISTWHISTCGWCKRANVSVTEPRDFCYPAAPKGGE